MSIPVEVEVPPLDNEPGPSEAVAIEPKLPKKQQLKQRRKARHFYFDDCRVVLQVDGQTYKIHRYFLTRESQFFKGFFSLPQLGDSASVEGSVPKTPANEVENLLRFFYFGMHDDYVASPADWIAMLSISTRLLFKKVRERAIKEITRRTGQVEPFEMIELAVKYDVKIWLKPAYHRIVTRNDLITHQEALKIPFPMIAMLMRSREQYWKNPVSPDHIIDSEIRVMQKASVGTMSGPDSEIVSETASVETKSEPKTALKSKGKKEKKKGKKKKGKNAAAV